MKCVDGMVDSEVHAVNDLQAPHHFITSSPHHPITSSPKKETT
jgi:hypothetical protein